MLRLVGCGARLEDLSRRMYAGSAIPFVAIAAAVVLVGAGGGSLAGLRGAEVGAAPELSFPVVHRVDGTVLDAGAFPGALPLFEERYVRGDPVGGDAQAIEPTIGLGPDGTLYYQASSKPTTQPTTVADVDAVSGVRPEVWRSEDLGLSWTDVSPQLHDALRHVPPLSRQAATPGFSGDPFLHVDPLTGRVINYQQQSYLLCDHFAVSDARGDSWRQRTTCPESLVADDSFGDHPSLVTGVPRAHDLPPGETMAYFCSSSGCRASADGGMTWGAPVQPYVDCETQYGHLDAAPDGTLYLPRKTCGSAQLAVSRDDGATWTQHVVDDTIWTHSHEAWEGSDHDAAVAVDAAGNVYYLWLSTDRMPYLAVSRDLGATWTAPMPVAPPGVTYALFPNVVAGDEGRIALAYLATDVASGSRDDPEAVWRMLVSVSLDALADAPVFATITAHHPDDPIRRGPCINFRCYIHPGPMGNGPPNEGVYDFLDVDLDPLTGRVVVALVDLCNGACGRPDGTPRDPAYARAAVGVQVGGALLRA